MEWLLFALMVIFEVLVIYGPGALVIKITRVPWTVAVLFAPLVSIAAYTILAIIYHSLGIPSNWMTLALVAAAIGGIGCPISWGLTRKEIHGAHKAIPKRSSLKRSVVWAYMALYAGVGVIITITVFASCFEVPSTFIQTFDNAAHLNMIQSFVASSDYSTLATTMFPEVEGDEFVSPRQGYYPAAWHGLGAMAYSAFGGSAAIAENALLFTLSAVVYPVSMLTLLLRLFGQSKRAIIAGSLLVLGFSAFPWRFLTFGPLFSNLLGYAVMPLIVVAFMGIFKEGAAARERVLFGALFCVGLICVVSTQPNSLFAMAVFLIPFCFMQVMHLADRIAGRTRNRGAIRVGCGVAYIIVVCVIWYAFYVAPPLQGTVQYPHAADLSVLRAAKHVVDLNTALMGPQIALALLIVLGAIYSLWKKRDLIWMVASYLLFAIIYVACVSASESIQHLLAGFWYSDFYRIAACLAVFGVPLACLGIECVCAIFMMLIAHFGKRKPTVTVERIVLILVCVLFVVCNFGSMVCRPLGIFGGNFDRTRDVIRELYADEPEQSLDPEEKRFVDEVLANIPEGSRVLNMPYDGSVFAFGYNGLGTYFREYNPTGMAAQPAQAALLRLSTDQAAINEDVATVLEGSGIDYLLLLDYEEGEGATLNTFSYGPEEWSGITGVRDGMPGFELVMSEGDMRLYRIIADGEAETKL